MPTNIYFIRHGKVSNKNNIFYGCLPRMGLSSIGREQIKSAGEYLKGKHIAKIFSSKLLRARQSASIISDILGCKDVSRINLITEINSYMEGKSFEFGKPSRFDHYFSPLRKSENETMDEIRDRMIRFIKLVEKKYKNENIAAIGHGDPLMILKASIEGLPMELESIRPGSGKYVKYGEIFLVRVENGNITIRSVFSPEI